MWYFPIREMKSQDAFRLEELCRNELAYQIGPFDRVLLHRDLLCIIDADEATFFFKDDLSSKLKKLLWKYLKGGEDGCIYPYGTEFYENYDSILENMKKAKESRGK